MFLLVLMDVCLNKTIVAYILLYEFDDARVVFLLNDSYLRQLHLEFIMSIISIKTKNEMIFLPRFPNSNCLISCLNRESVGASLSLNSSLISFKHIVK